MEKASPLIHFLYFAISGLCSSLSNAESPPLCTTLTSLTVFPSKPERAVAAEGAPQVHTGPPVQTRVSVAEVSFGRATWPTGRKQMCLAALRASNNDLHQSLARMIRQSKPGPDLKRTAGGRRPGRVPLLAMKPAMSTCWLSTRRFFMQPTNCRLRMGKSSGSFGTPPRSRGPVRSSDLRRPTVTPTRGD